MDVLAEDERFAFGTAEPDMTDKDIIDALFPPAASWTEGMECGPRRELKDQVEDVRVGIVVEPGHIGRTKIWR